MSETLRPLDLGEILDKTVQLYRSRFLVFLGIAALPMGWLLACIACVALLISWANASPSSGGADPTAVAVVLVIFGLLGLLALSVYAAAAALGTAAMNHAAAATYFGGRVTIRGAYKVAWQRGWRYIGLYLLKGFIVWGIPIAAWFVLMILGPMVMVFARAAGGGGAGIFTGFLFFFLFLGIIVYFVLALLRLCLAFPACIVEQSGVWESIKRGNALSQGTRGRIFLLGLLVVVLGWILSMAVIVPTMIGMAMMPGMRDPAKSETLGMTILLISYAVSFAVQAFTQPVSGIALMLFYYDQRIRKEGYDIEWMMRQAGLVVPVAAPAPEPAAAFMPAVDSTIPQSLSEELP